MLQSPSARSSPPFTISSACSQVASVKVRSQPLVVQVVEPPLLVEQRPEVARAVQQDDALAELLGFGKREGVIPAYVHLHTRRLVADEVLCLAVSAAQAVALRQRSGRAGMLG